MNDAQIRKLAKHAEIVQCYAGEVIQRPEEHLEALLLVVAGRLTVSFCSSTGDAAPFQQLGLDDQFGLLLLESDAPFPVQLTADHNATLLRIPKDSAVQLLKDIPLWRRNLFRTVGPRLLEVVSSTKRPKIRRFVVFLHLTDETRNVSKAVVQRLEQLGERVCLLSDRETAFDSSHCRFEPLLDSSKRLRASEEIRKIVARESDASRVILEGQLSVFEDRLPTITDWAGAVYLVCQDESTKLAASELKSIIGSSHTTLKTA